MIKKEEISQINGNIKDVFEKQFNLGYTITSIAIRKGDVRVNGEKIKTNVSVKIGDTITIFYKEKEFKPVVVFEDDNVLIVSKSKKIEVVSRTGESLTDKLEKIYPFVKPCHRIDFNTTGLVVFAKNSIALSEILNAFKNGNVTKFYEAIVVGKPRQSADLVAYLKKDPEKSYVFVSKDSNCGDEIKTSYTLIKQINSELALLRVQLHTGKTHQIRAHLAFEHLPVLGDDKYGIKAVNNAYKQKSQCLVSVQIGFNFGKESPLCYLNDKTFKIDSGLENTIRETF